MHWIPTIERLSSQVYQQDGRHTRYYWCRYRDHVDCRYRFAERIGCYFNLAGDVIPDQKLAILDK